MIVGNYRVYEQFWLEDTMSISKSEVEMEDNYLLELI
jgi:hypothetical protein